VRGRAVDERADVYALGLILNELFTGELAHRKDFKTVGATRAELAYLDATIDKMLQQDPGMRYRNVDELKSDLIAQEQTWVAKQRLSAARDAVIPASEVDDPLVADPPRIVSVDWSDGRITITLHRELNENWVWSFRNMGSHSSVYGVSPDRFSIVGNALSAHCSGHDAPRVLDYFKDWLPKINRVYADRVIRLEQVRQAEEIASLKERARREQERLDVIGRLKI
jgi:serine/threonine protein kinase